MKLQPKTVRRCRKLEVALILLCLCFENITSVSSLRPSFITKDGQSLNGQPTNNMKSGDTTALTRKTRTLLQDENSSSTLRKKNKIEEQNSGSNQYYSIPYLKTDSTYALKDKRNEGTLIPFPRLGRSGRFDENSIMPYPDSWLTPERKLQKTKDEKIEMDEPIFDEAQFDEDYGDDINAISEEQSSINEEDEFLEESSLSPEVKIGFESSSLIKERQVDNNGTVIPYPRLGRSHDNSFSDFLFKLNEDAATRRKRSSDSLIPQFRYGRSKPQGNSIKQQKQQFYILPNIRPGRSLSSKDDPSKYEGISKPALLPYPRPGRSETNIEKRQDYMLPVARFGRTIGKDLYLQKVSMDNQLMKQENFDHVKDDLTKADKSAIFLIPYPRPGKRFFGTKPLPPNVKLETKEKSESLLEDNKDSEEIPVTFVLPYPRPGRSDKVSSLIPSIRFGRSSASSLVPYPRVGRSNNDPNNHHYMLPYPRSGRSNDKFSIMPNIRFGRSDPSILPSFRFGRSSNSILPYPRLGRSSNKKFKLKSSNSELLLPYPRLGRRSSSGIIPQIRVGRSNVYLQPEGDLSEILTHFEVLGEMKNDYLTQIGKEKELESSNLKETLENSVAEENRMKSALLKPAKKLKHMLTSDTHYMLPYPRPGRQV